MNDPTPRKTRSLGQPLWFAASVLGLFVLYFALQPERDNPREIRVTAAVAEEIAADRKATVGRRPSSEELDELVEIYVEEEMLIREAKARGIECSGCNGRKHLIKRLLFVLGEPPGLPTDEELAAFFAMRRDDYQVPSRLSYEQVYFPQPPDDPQAVLAALREGADPKSFGERFWTGNRSEGISRIQVSTILGEPYATALFASPQGEWSGPHRSPRGFHFVRVFDHMDPRPAEFREVRTEVELDWTRWTMNEARGRLVATIRGNYEVEIEPLASLR